MTATFRRGRIIVFDVLEEEAAQLLENQLNILEMKPMQTAPASPKGQYFVTAWECKSRELTLNKIIEMKDKQLNYDFGLLDRYIDRIEARLLVGSVVPLPVLVVDASLKVQSFSNVVDQHALWSLCASLRAIVEKLGGVSGKFNPWRPVTPYVVDLGWLLEKDEFDKMMNNARKLAQARSGLNRMSDEEYSRVSNDLRGCEPVYSLVQNSDSDADSFIMSSSNVLHLLILFRIQYEPACFAGEW